VRDSRGLTRSALALASAEGLEEVLQTVTDAARELLAARYAALGVLNSDGTGLSRFLTAGISEELHERIGSPPKGHGVLGLLIREPHPIRLADIADHPDSVGFPPHHPPMKSFLGVPVIARGRVYGNLYLAEKEGADEFTPEDLVLLEAFASQAAIAIENAELRAERDRFFAAATHELGNSIEGIDLWARRLLRKDPEDAAAWRDAMERIHMGAEQARRMIEDLLGLQRLREGRLILHPRTVDVAAIAREAAENAAAEAEVAEVRLDAAGAEEPVEVVADPLRVRQILDNLIRNAIKFSPPGGRVEVAAGTDGGAVRISVRDEGPGIDPEDRERIFEPYVQLGGAEGRGGQGLGLPLSRQLARLMDGEVTVEAAPGAGSIFTLHIPLTAG
jgi:signal transduction histidine kinase